MARGARILRARLDVSLVDRGCYETVEVTAAQHPSETRERAIVRLLARALFHAPELGFGRGVSTAEEPDLWSRLPDGRVEHWIEVGQPKERRLRKATRLAERVTVLAFGSGVVPWRERELTGLEAPPQLHVLSLADEFVAALAEGSDKKLDWAVTSSGGSLYVATGPDEPALETTPEIWLGDPLG